MGAAQSSGQTPIYLLRNEIEARVVGRQYGKDISLLMSLLFAMFFVFFWSGNLFLTTSATWVFLCLTFALPILPWLFIPPLCEQLTAESYQSHQHHIQSLIDNGYSRKEAVDIKENRYNAQLTARAIQSAGSNIATAQIASSFNSRR